VSRSNQLTLWQRWVRSFGGLLWSKQFYHYVVRDWLHGDPGQPPPPDQRNNGRNREWGHLYNADVICDPVLPRRPLLNVRVSRRFGSPNRRPLSLSEEFYQGFYRL
jgi:hypothetical protein